MTDTLPAPDQAEAEAPTAAPAGKPPHPRPPNQPRKGPPRGRQPQPAHPALEKLFELYPGLFGAQFKPLKIGVFDDLLARHPDVFQKDELKVALGLHARSTAYLESVAAGQQRHDLDGQPVAPVAPEHVHHAIMEVFRRRQVRTREDLRPRVIPRLVAAIQGSGMAPLDYAEKMRTADQTANSMLDEAVSQLAQAAAKREALTRAFQASGLDLEAFAEMYGMDPAEVARTLA
jgi:ProP effector